MDESAKAQTFIDALHILEQTNDVGPLVELFSETASLTNPHRDEPQTGRNGARAFWEAYRQAFEEIRSSFRTVIEENGVSSLEWISEGTLRPANAPVQYGGVTMLEWNQDRIERFATYFDTRRLEVDTGSTGGIEQEALEPGQLDTRTW